MTDTLDALQARLVSASGVLVFDDSTPAALRLWFCARVDAPPHGRWFQARRDLPQPVTALPGEWIELWREHDEADAHAEGLERKRHWCQWWEQATKHAAHTGLYVSAVGTGDAVGADANANESTSSRSAFWLAFCPDGRTFSNDSARQWPHPARWLLRWNHREKRQPRRHAMGPRHERSFDELSRKARKAIWIETRNAIRVAQGEQPGVAVLVALRLAGRRTSF